MTESTTERSLEATAVLEDYRLAVQSRYLSLIGRREVMSGKAKFGIFGDGKEIAQIAMAKAWRPGDWRSGYYRDQTLMMALGLLTVEQFFAQLYAHADVEADPHSAGRQMNAHFATRFISPDGDWLDQTSTYNVSADLSPTGSQMPRLVGLGYASTLYRQLEELADFAGRFSNDGNEVAWGTIGNASTSEGMFWEAVNAIGVLGAPVVLTIWDDGYGISVPNEFQTTKGDLSQVLSGFQRTSNNSPGYDIYRVKGWDYPTLIQTFVEAAETARRDHVPAIVHVVEVTQPQGHSTSGSHERYKSAERLGWEEEYDGIRQMRLWMMAQGLATAAELDAIDKETRRSVESRREQAWEDFVAPFEAERADLLELLDRVWSESSTGDAVGDIRTALINVRQPLRKDVMSAARRALVVTRGESGPLRQELVSWVDAYAAANRERYGSHLYNQTGESALDVPEVPPLYDNDPERVMGFQVLNANFDVILGSDPRVVAFGEDVGHLGGVNQAFAGLQDKYGLLRVADTGIREVTIIGQAIGMAQRGLRPIAEIQYLDYLLYALQILSDDVATLHWRTKGGQKAPVIVRTRGHRLEGIWHSGSLMGSVVNLLRGMHVLVPRDMTQAAGFYNTLLRGDEPAIVVETLNAYRNREPMPDNLGEFTIPLGVPEIVREGADVTVVTYGALVPIALEAADLLADAGVEIEVIDVRSLLPFDIHGMIRESLAKTSRVVFLDEDVPGGSSAYMMQQVLQEQGGFWLLDSEPRTLTAQPHRPAYGSDGNYFSKPNVEDIVETVYDLMNEFNPAQYPPV